MNKIELVKKIHASPVKIVLAIAGGGSEAISELLRYGGGSKTILDAQVPYCQKAFEEFIGGKPDKFVSEDAACQLATAAYRKCVHLAGETTDKLIGVGATISLVKANEREGRQHVAWIAIQTGDKVVTYNVDLRLYMPETNIREKEEEEIANRILDFLAWEVYGYVPDSYSLEANIGKAIKIYSLPELEPIYKGKNHQWVCLTDKNKDPLDGKPRLVMPGSFNPIHTGHLQMAETVSKMQNKKVDFEISAINVEKPVLSQKTILERLTDWHIHAHDEGYLGDLWITNQPLFVNKSMIFANASFIVGYDTFERIASACYYPNKSERDWALSIIKNNVRNIIVFPRRKTDGNMSTIEDIKFDELKPITTFIPDFSVDVSSREIRNGRTIQTNVGG